MNVDSCLNANERKSFELIKLKNKQSFDEILNDLKEPVDCVVHDTGEDVNFSNFEDKIKSKATFKHINVPPTHDLKISKNMKIYKSQQNECAEVFDFFVRFILLHYLTIIWNYIRSLLIDNFFLIS